MKSIGHHIKTMIGGNSFLPLVLSILPFLVSATSCSSQNEGLYNTQKGVAIKGYDPVAYFESDKATKGNKEITYTYMGVEYRFANDKNKKLFMESPEKYSPAYGGWCAYAMGDSGDKVNIDPETYKIKDGRLFLFYNSLGNNTLEPWNEDEEALEKAADLHWNEIISEQN